MKKGSKKKPQVPFADGPKEHVGLEQRWDDDPFGVQYLATKKPAKPVTPAKPKKPGK
jgi:hypothetical protein